ncbi:phage recombination protein Bet [Leptotrichia trevisanii]|jgi:phage recombination protein bet|uniref:phage recombination protein Bet n=1 Tax=Leptotrichia trevisanii TaxID=109328 RepID=UPI0004105D6F|nr:phage recombination protein Bet [Leptotrichia trevisanii]
MGRLGNEKHKNDDKVMNFKVGNDNVQLSINLVKRYLSGDNPNVTESEIMYFMKLCKARGLNPYIRDAYLIKYGNQPAAIIVAKDAVEKRAIQNPKYDGKEVGIYVENKETGELIKREGSILRKNKEELVGAWCTVYRKDWKYPITKEVNFDEYIQKKKDGTPNTNWENRPVTMITKVAIVQALREAFIEELSGMYEAEEMGVNESELDNTPIQVDENETYDKSDIDDAEIVEENDDSGDPF